jgi:predicted transcriptional regulator
MNPQPNLQKRRDKLVIMADILQIARKGALKTQILYKANLSFEQLKQYLNLLTATDMLKKTRRKQREVYEATPKGLEFLKTHKEIMDFLNQDAEGNLKLPSESVIVTTREEVK